ncbi:hypothetical protein CF336_g2294 [Tilletia laevis]|nr:hypothetical protein CF336_g2294 [Tilletia laevis]
MTDSIEHGEAIALQSTTLPMSTSTSSSHQDADATLTDLNESTGAGGVSAEADASTSDDQHQHYSGGSALAGAKQPDPSGAGGTQAAPQPSPDDYRNLRKSLLETRAILRTAADAFAVLASSRGWQQYPILHARRFKQRLDQSSADPMDDQSVTQHRYRSHSSHSRILEQRHVGSKKSSFGRAKAFRIGE